MSGDRQVLQGLSAEEGDESWRELTAGGLTAAVNRYTTLIERVSIALSPLSVLLIVRRLPVEPLGKRLEGWIKGLSLWGPGIFGAVGCVADGAPTGRWQAHKGGTVKISKGVRLAAGVLVAGTVAAILIFCRSRTISTSPWSGSVGGGPGVHCS